MGNRWVWCSKSINGSCGIYYNNNYQFSVSTEPEATRMIAYLNAMDGIDDPQAFVEAALLLAARVPSCICGYNRGHPGYNTPTGHRWDCEEVRDALLKLRAAMAGKEINDAQD
jgi:hypothetical protein